MSKVETAQLSGATNRAETQETETTTSARNVAPRTASKRKASASNQAGSALPVTPSTAQTVAAVNAGLAAKESAEKRLESAQRDNARLTAQLKAMQDKLAKAQAGDTPPAPIADADLAARIAALEDYASKNKLAPSYSLLRIPEGYGIPERVEPIAFTDAQKKAWREAKKRIDAINRAAAVGFRRTFSKLVDRAVRDPKSGLKARHKQRNNGGVSASMAVRIPGKQSPRKKDKASSVSRPKP